MKRRHTTTAPATIKVYSMSVRQVADTLDVSTETVKRWARSGRIDARKNTSGNWVFAPDDVDAMRSRNIVIERQS